MRERGKVRLFNRERSLGFLVRSGYPDLYFNRDELAPVDEDRIHSGVRADFVVHLDELGRPRAVGLTFDTASL